jgi:hypothetical protein
MAERRRTQPAEQVLDRMITGERSLESLSSLRLPSDLEEAAVRRLRLISLLYSAIFFLAAILPNIVCHLIALVEPSAVCSRGYFTTARTIGPPVLSILAGLGVFLFVITERQTVKSKQKVGLQNQELVSNGNALSEYQGIVSPS